MQFYHRRFAVAGPLFLLSLFLAIAPVRANPAPGGIIETRSDTTARPRYTAGEISNFMPNRGVFRFPAPYNTEGVRITNASDCNGGDCVHYAGYSYWRNINNHAGSDTMLMFLALKSQQGGSGLTLFGYDKIAKQVSKLGSVFPSGSNFNARNGEGLYFSATKPHELYVSDGARLLRYNVVTETFTTLFDARTQYGTGVYLWQHHSSDDDRVHSASLRRTSNYSFMGCVVYREDTSAFQLFTPIRGDFDECQVDKSGDWLVIKENVSGRYGEDNRIINLNTGSEFVLYDEAGAGGHSDNGYGYMLAEDNWANLPGSVKVWQFANMNQSTLAYNSLSWSVDVGHVAHSNARPDLPVGQQFACSSQAGGTNIARSNEIICYRLDGSRNVLVVAPVLTDLSASGGGSDRYNKLPKANIDPTGEYMLWTTNLGSNRLDALVVRVPSQLLYGGSPPPPVAPADPTAPEPQPPEEPVLPEEPELPTTGSSLLGHWPLTDGEGTFAYDIAGADRHGSLVHGEWHTSSLYLDGIDTYVEVPHDSALNAFPLTITAWVRSRETSFGAIVNKYTAASLNGYQLFANDGALCAWYFRDSNNYIWDGTGCTMRVEGIADGQWHHTALVIDGSGGTLFVDGIARAQESWTGSPGSPSSRAPILLGLYPGIAASLGNGLWSGSLADVQLLQGASHPDDIAQAAAAGPPREPVEENPTLTPVSHWPTDEGRGSVIRDIAGGHNGRLRNDTRWLSTRGGLRFNGQYSFVEVAHTPAHNAYPLSISLWVRVARRASGGVISKYRQSAHSGYQMYFRAGILCSSYSRNGNNFVGDNTTCPGAVSGLDDSRWHHITWVINEQGSTVYVDGQSRATESWYGSAGAASNFQPLYVGRASQLRWPILSGDVANIAIYDDSLTPSNVIDMARSWAPPVGRLSSDLE